MLEELKEIRRRIMTVTNNLNNSDELKNYLVSLNLSTFYTAEVIMEINRIIFEDKDNIYNSLTDVIGMIIAIDEDFMVDIDKFNNEYLKNLNGLTEDSYSLFVNEKIIKSTNEFELKMYKILFVLAYIMQKNIK